MTRDAGRLETALLDAAAVRRRRGWRCCWPRTLVRRRWPGGRSSRGPGRSRRSGASSVPIAIAGLAPAVARRRRLVARGVRARGTGHASPRARWRCSGPSPLAVSASASRRAGTSRAGACAARSSSCSPALAARRSAYAVVPRVAALGVVRALARAARGRRRSSAAWLGRRLRAAAPLPGLSRGASSSTLLVGGGAGGPRPRAACEATCRARVAARRGRARRSWSSALRGVDARAPRARSTASATCGSILVEHAPILGRAVEAAERSRAGRGAVGADVAPTPTSRRARSRDRSTGPATTSSSSRSTRCAPTTSRPTATPRPTTPNLDALAREGTLFDGRVLPDAAHVVLDHVDDDRQVPAAAPRARPGRGLARRGRRTCAATAGGRRRSIRPRCSSSTRTASRASRTTHLGFEYAKVEFADPALREQQVADVPRRRAAPTARSSSGSTSSSRTSPTSPHPDHVFRAGRRPTSTPTTARSPTADDGIGRDRAARAARTARARSSS